MHAATNAPASKPIPFLPDELFTAVSAKVSRRSFLEKSSLAVAGLAILQLPTHAGEEVESKGLVGSNIYGWGQYAQRENRPLDVESVISALRDCGYDYLENSMDVAHPEENARFADQLKNRGLRPVSLYSGGRLHETGKAGETVGKILTAAKICQKAGFSSISCNPDPIGREKTDPELRTQATALEDLGRGLTEIGMRLGIHHHLPEMANSAREFHYVFRNTDPELVGFCYDVHWVWKGGVKPADALQQYGKRIVSWHLRQSREGVWWEDLDAGDIDYPAVAEYVKEHDLPRLFTVELALEGGTKISRSVIENHRRSREYVRRTFGV